MASMLSQFPVRNADAGRIRGAALRELVIWFEREHDGDALNQVVEVLTDRYPDTFQPGLPAFGVLSSRWYDAGAIHALLDLLHKASGNPRFAEEGAQAVMSKTLSGVFKAMTRFLLTPERYAKHAHRLWGHYYDSGVFELRMTSDSSTRTVIRDWPSHHPILCDMNSSAAAEIYRTIGCEDVRVTRVKCVSHGGPRCEYEVTWRP